MKLVYLTAEQIIAINREVTLASGDPFAVENESNLQHLVEAVKYKYENKESEEALVLKAAYFVDMLANKGHVFAEGNKRTAITATIAFFEINGFEIDTNDQTALVEFVLNVAKGAASLHAIADWLRRRVKKRV